MKVPCMVWRSSRISQEMSSCQDDCFENWAKDLSIESWKKTLVAKRKKKIVITTSTEIIMSITIMLGSEMSLQQYHPKKTGRIPYWIFFSYFRCRLSMKGCLLRSLHNQNTTKCKLCRQSICLTLTGAH